MREGFGTDSEEEKASETALFPLKGSPADADIRQIALRKERNRFGPADEGREGCVPHMKTEDETYDYGKRKKSRMEIGGGGAEVQEVEDGSGGRNADAVDEALDENSRKRIVETESEGVCWRISKRKGRAGGKPAGFLVSVRKRIGRGGSFLAAEFPVDGDGLYELLYFACACAGEEIGEEEMEIEDE